jgi:hypothetical protein
LFSQRRELAHVMPRVTQNNAIIMNIPNYPGAHVDSVVPPDWLYPGTMQGSCLPVYFWPTRCPAVGKRLRRRALPGKRRQSSDQCPIYPCLATLQHYCILQAGLLVGRESWIGSDARVREEPSSSRKVHRWHRFGVAGGSKW